MVVIGLTGKMGTGKSTVSQILAKLGATVIDADKLGHELLEPRTQTWGEVVTTFGRDVLKADDQIDRQKLAQIVFSDPKRLSVLNEIMHPRIDSLLRTKLEKLRSQNVSVVVLEIPFPVRTGWIDLVDQLWVTTAPEEVILKRLVKERGLNKAQILARLESQLPQVGETRQADVVIDTDCDLPELEAKVKKLWQALSKQRRI